MEGHSAIVSSLNTITPLLSVTLDAMGVQLPDLDADHPNRWPFTGVLTLLDTPSDRPPNGAHGHRVLIPTDVAARRLDTLIGMAVDIAPEFGEHNPQRKVGIITSATIQGQRLCVEGILYQQDFPHEIAALRAKSRSGELGMSFEVTRARVDDPSADVWVVRDLIFTGAAILKRASAAYHSTALAASAEGDEPMLTSALGSAVYSTTLTATGVSATITATSDPEAVSSIATVVAEVASALAASTSSDTDAALGARLVAALKAETGVSAVSSFKHLLSVAAATFALTVPAFSSTATVSLVDTARLTAAKATKEEAMRRAMSACLRAMQHFMGDDSEAPMDPEHEDEAQDLAMLKKLVQKFAGRGTTAQAAAQKGANMEASESQAILSAIAALGVRLSAMEAAQAGTLLTDKPASVSGELLTDKSQQKSGLVTDGAVKRTTMAAAHDPVAYANGAAFLAKYNLDANADYSDADLDKALVAVRDPTQRLAVKIELENLKKSRPAA